MAPARVTVLTIGVRDLARMRKFYADLGWPLAIELEDLAAFQTHGAVLVLYPLDRLAADANLAVSPPDEGIGGFNPAINVDRPEEVDETVAAVEAAGGRVPKPPVQAEWGGRTAYFADPENNLWEVAWVPPDSNMHAAIRKAGGFGPGSA
jgi:catechol 2,3-dioxygenase-like lactoylglutathione lyase family enzyme